MELASSPTSSTSATKNADPLLLNMFNDGHKVVAYPGIFAAKSNEASVGVPTGSSSLFLSSTSKREKPRSVSAGRVRRSGRDLVMDVYERLGVDRPDTSNSNHRAKKSGTSAKAAAPRGRSPGLRTAADQKRARSLSRGRVRNRWPPVRQAEPVRDNDEDVSPPASETTTVFDEPPLSPKQQQQQRSYKARAAAVYLNASSREEQSSKESYQDFNKNKKNNNTSSGMTTKDLMVNTSKSLTDWRRTLEIETTTTSYNIPRSIQRTTSSDPSDCWKDEKKECNAIEDQTEQQQVGEDCTSPTSVKERMLAFGGDSKSSSKSSAASRLRRSVDKQYAAQFAVREHPPKIDIYEAAKNQLMNTCQDAESPLDGEDQKKPAAAASLEDELMYHHGRRRQPAVEPSAATASVKSFPSPHNVVSTNITNNKGNIAEAFLAAIHTQTPSASMSPHRTPPIHHTRSHSFAPVAEVVSTEDHGSVLENVSLLSTNSEDNQHNQLSPPPRGSAKKSWNRVSAYTSSPAGATGSGSRHMSMSSLPIPPYAGASPSQQHRTAAPTMNNNNNNSNTAINEQHVERLVEERVRSRVGDLERNMLDQLQTFMTRLDERMESRVARLERTVHALLMNRDGQPPPQEQQR